MLSLINLFRKVYITLTLYFTCPCRLQVGCSQSHPTKVNVIYIFLIVSIFDLTQFHLILQNVQFNIMQYSGCMSVQVCCCHIGSISAAVADPFELLGPSCSFLRVGLLSQTEADNRAYVFILLSLLHFF